MVWFHTEPGSGEYFSSPSLCLSDSVSPRLAQSAMIVIVFILDEVVVICAIIVPTIYAVGAGLLLFTADSRIFLLIIGAHALLVI